ncbi:hypothetical protein [Salinivibrio socompensis]|nr:hypothetical protein [Salinivibrio socompensis]
MRKERLDGNSAVKSGQTAEDDFVLFPPQAVNGMLSLRVLTDLR